MRGKGDGGAVPFFVQLFPLIRDEIPLFRLPLFRLLSANTPLFVSLFTAQDNGKKNPAYFAGFFCTLQKSCLAMRNLA